MAFESSERESCYLIAEIGVNHGGDMELARAMVDAAAESGADAVKFQTFTAETLVTPGTPKVRYQESTTAPDETHFEMIRSLEFDRDDHVPLMEYCEQVGVDFISTPYDIESARFLDSIGVEVFKTASADIVDLPLLEFIAGTGRPVYIATGMATLGEIEQAVQVFREEADDPDLTLLHCVSNYPCTDAALNLRVLETLACAFGFPVGFSDHSVGPQAAVISVALGASVVEKHFTLDKGLPGPDHAASSTPDEFAELVRAVRRAELSMGSPVKACQDEERQMSRVSRKSVTIGQSLAAGDEITADHIVMRRPGIGLPASDLPRILGRKARRDLCAGTLVGLSDLE